MSTLSKNSEDLSCDSCCYIGVRKQSSWVSHSHWITVLSIKHETIDQYLAGEKKSDEKNIVYRQRTIHLKISQKCLSNPFTFNDSCNIGNHLMSVSELHCRLDQNLLTGFSARIARNRVTELGVWDSVSRFGCFPDDGLCFLNEWLKKSAGLILIILRLDVNFNSSGATLYRVFKN